VAAWQPGRVTDDVVRYDIGFVPNAGAPSPILHQTERAAVLVFFGQPTDRPGERHRVLVEVFGCMIATFGYPNDEALPGHPLHAAGLSYSGVFEVLAPSWRDRVIAQNLRSFPSTPKQYATRRHFVITFQDSTFECLADDLRARLAPPGSIEGVLAPYL
jgi:hypothetical protein